MQKFTKKRDLFSEFVVSENCRNKDEINMSLAENNAEREEIGKNSKDLYNERKKHSVECSIYIQEFSRIKLLLLKRLTPLLSPVI